VSSSAPLRPGPRARRGLPPTRSRRRRSALLALATAGALAVGLLVSPAAAAPGVSTLPVAADAYVSSAKPTKNYGRASSLWVDGSPLMRTYLRFDLPDGNAIARARLQVYATRSAERFEVRRATGSWTESGLTARNAPPPEAAAVPSGAVVEGSWVTVDVTSLLPATGPFTLVLTPVSSTSQAVRSRESGAASAPRLLLDATASTVDTTAPAVRLTAPTAGTTYTAEQSVAVTAAATDDVGVTKVDFYDNGVYQGTEDTSPFVLTWPVSSAANGTHRWTAEAHDAAGNSALSAAVEVTVDVPATSTSPPATSGPRVVSATVETDPVHHSGDAADDAAIWIHPTDPSLSTVIGTDKLGGLAVYDLSGRQVHRYTDAKPNNVDIRYGFPLGGHSATIVVTSEKSDNSLRVYEVDEATRGLRPVSARTLSVGIGLYGLCLYKSPVTGRYYAFDSDSSGTLQQWELFDDGAGRVDARKVRQISTGTTTEGCAADDRTGDLFVAEEDVAIWRYGAEPGSGTARTQVDAVGAGRLVADIEGLALYYGRDGAGYLLASSQGSSSFVVYDRQPPHAPVTTFTVGAGAVDAVSYTDGIDVTNAYLGPAFPEGVFVAQDDRNDVGNQNYKLVPWGSIARAGSPTLLVDTGYDPRTGGAHVGAPPPEPAPEPDPAPAPAAGPTYYVDSTSGSDAAAGTTAATAWRTLARATRSLPAGSTLLLRRGGSWKEQLLLADSGTGDAPVTVATYGTGARPVITGSSTCVAVTGDHVAIRGLEARSCTWAGIAVSGTGTTVEDNLVSDTAAGIYLRPGSSSNRVLRNALVDNNRMSVLTQTSTNDDSGAFGVLVRGDDNEVAWNTVSGSDAFSYDYGRDGAAIEIYDAVGNHVHHNTAVDNDAFAELGGPRSADNTFAYNVVRSSLETSVFLVTRGADSRYGPVLRTRLHNNTALMTGAQSQGFVCHAGCSSSVLTMRNNVVQAVWKAGFADAPFDEADNLYWGGARQFVLGPGSLVAEPGFRDASAGDLRLTPGSPAVDTGTQLGYAVDLDGGAVPQDGDGDGVATTDKGAYELRP
jgi:parallel beta-helix repeat protein